MSVVASKMAAERSSVIGDAVDQNVAIGTAARPAGLVADQLSQSAGALAPQLSQTSPSVDAGTPITVGSSGPQQMKQHAALTVSHSTTGLSRKATIARREKIAGSADENGVPAIQRAASHPAANEAHARTTALFGPSVVDQAIIRVVAARKRRPPSVTESQRSQPSSRAGRTSRPEVALLPKLLPNRASCREIMSGRTFDFLEKSG